MLVSNYFWLFHKAIPGTVPVVQIDRIRIAASGGTGTQCGTVGTRYLIEEIVGEDAEIVVSVDAASQGSDLVGKTKPFYNVVFSSGLNFISLVMLVNKNLYGKF
jgi:hypothetical protein